MSTKLAKAVLAWWEIHQDDETPEFVQLARTVPTQAGMLTDAEIIALADAHDVTIQSGQHRESPFVEGHDITSNVLNFARAILTATSPDHDALAKDAEIAVDGIRFDLFPGYLIDHCEGEIISEEGLQCALTSMLVSDEYLTATAAPPAPEPVKQEGFDAAIDAVYPIPDSPHASVLQKAMDNRIAYRWGWENALEQNSHEPVKQDSPIDMVLHCPACGLQHIDAPEARKFPAFGPGMDVEPWTNPPHRSHLCHGCGHTWRPADVPTNGVAAVTTTGSKDSPIVAPVKQDGQADERELPPLPEAYGLLPYKDDAGASAICGYDVDQMYAYARAALAAPPASAAPVEHESDRTDSMGRLI